MRAISLHQPWASLIAIGVKPFEFRTWPAPKSIVGERIAIHAAQQRMSRVCLGRMLYELGSAEGCGFGLSDRQRAYDFLLAVSAGEITLPYGAVVCTAVVGKAMNCRDAFPDDPDVDPEKWAWPVSKIEVLAPPVPAKGWQRIWTWTPPDGLGHAA